jgi:hypothetical protein
MPNLSTFPCPVFAHTQCWFGSGNTAHKDMNYDSSDPVTIFKQSMNMRSRGITGVNPLWSGNDKSKDNIFSTKTVNNWFKVCEATGFPIFLTIDHPESFPLDSIKALSTYFASPAYYRWQGKPVLLAFDPLTSAQLSVLADCALIYRNSGGVNLPKSSGAFEWPAPPATQSYTDFFHKQTAPALAAGKLIINHVCPGFLGASWNKPGQVIPWRSGQEWEDSKSRVPASPMMVLVTTWNDHDEGSGIEFTYFR